MKQESKLVATVFALAAFAVAIGAGLAAGNETRIILLRAVGAMAACQMLGVLAGAVVQRVLHEHAERTQRAQNVDDGGEPAQEEKIGAIV